MLRLTKIFLIISWVLSSGAAYIFFFTLSKCIDDAQFFLGYVFFDQTLFSHCIICNITCISVTEGIMMNRRQW